MDALRTSFDHPYVLIAALLLSFPCFVLIAQTIFPDPEQDARDDLWALPAILLGQTPLTVIGMKIVAFFIVCGAFTMMFYKVGAWLVSWF
jgi:hypothetical protein